jgi:hypothetical protein
VSGSHTGAAGKQPRPVSQAAHVPPTQYGVAAGQSASPVQSGCVIGLADEHDAASATTTQQEIDRVMSAVPLIVPVTSE